MFSDKKCLYALFADVVSVSPKSGSKEGGTLLTISGRYFGNRTDLVTVKVGGVDCDVKTVKPDEITCITGPERDGIILGENQYHTGITNKIKHLMTC